MQFDTKTGMADRPSERRCRKLRLRTWRGRGRGFPRHTLEDKVVRIAAKPLSDTPRGMVEEALQAPGGRRRRPSRASLRPME